MAQMKSRITWNLPEKGKSKKAGAVGFGYLAAEQLVFGFLDCEGLSDSQARELGRD